MMAEVLAIGSIVLAALLPVWLTGERSRLMSHIEREVALREALPSGKARRNVTRALERSTNRYKRLASITRAGRSTNLLLRGVLFGTPLFAVGLVALLVRRSDGESDTRLAGWVLLTLGLTPISLCILYWLYIRLSLFLERRRNRSP